jgi:alkylation response protein AidB-like acyl-CoA dehydrogenase
MATSFSSARRETKQAMPLPAAGEQPMLKVRKPTARALRAQVDRACAALVEAIAKKDLDIFYRVFRASDLVLLGPAYSADPRGLHAACFDVLRRLGSISPAVGVAVYNHYAVTCSMATFPLRNDPALEARRQAILQSFIAGRLLVANTTSRIHTDKVNTYGSIARREGDGFRVSGAAAYMSLATQSDIIIFFTEIEGGGRALFIAPLRNNPEIEIGPFLFPGAMVDSDTRRVTFHNTYVAAENALVADDSIGAFQVAWHQALFAGPFLGAAARALEEARKFLRTVRGPNDKPLGTLDGMLVDMGRMAIHYRSACAISQQAGQALESVARLPPNLPKFENAFHLACAAKQVGTKAAEEIVTQVRHMIGGRTFANDHPMERISQEVMFGPLGGEINAVIERRYGRLVLGEQEFLNHPW